MDDKRNERVCQLKRELAAARAGMSRILGEQPPSVADVSPASAAPVSNGTEGKDAVRSPSSPYDFDRELSKAARILSLANVSHELRTPLNGMIGSIEALEESSLDAPQREHLALMRESTEALLSTVNNLLDHVEIQAEGLRLTEEVFAIRVLAAELVAEFRPQAESKNLSFTAEVEPVVPTHFQGDTAKLRRALAHLLGNAVKFTEKGDVSLTIGVEDREGDEITLRFEVVDTGVGMPEGEQERLFAPFTQLDSSLQRRFGGTGLGLSISRRLVERMGGRIQLESEVGEGTRFRVFLSLPVAEGATHVDGGAEGTVRKGRILVVDDNATNRKVASAILEKLGHKAHAVDGGQEALRALCAEPFDLVLMDVQMPGMDGLETTRAIRSSVEPVRDPNVVIVALTAHTGHDDRQRFLEAGMNGSLAKPVKPAVLECALSRWLHKVPPPLDAVESLGDGGEGSDEEKRAPQIPIYDREGLLERVGDDEELLGEVIEIFVEETPLELKAVREAVDSGDLELLQRAAHTVKGAARNVGAMRLGEVAYVIETAAKSGDLKTAREQRDTLAAEFTAFQAAVG